MIERSVIENVIETANSRIVDVISEFVSLKRRGANYVGCCPFHNEKTGSFTVSPAKGFYKCFGCGKAGNALNFIIEYEHLTFVEAIKNLGDKFGIRVEEKEATPEMMQAKSDRESMMAVMEYAHQKFIDNLWNTEEGQSIGLPYFRKERGLRDDIIKKFELGYSFTRRDAFTNEALNNGFKLEFLQKTGMTIVGDNNYRADRFFGRFMFPVQNKSGKVIAFGGRVMVKSEKAAKYLNSPESEIYHKSDTLYGIYQSRDAISKKKRCYLVEGYFDVIGMHQAGIENVVASSGTSLTTNQVKLIQNLTNDVTVLYDGDAAGIHAAMRGIPMLLSEGLNVKVLLLPDGEDPDSFARAHSAEEFVQYIEDNQTDFIKFQAQLYQQEAGNDPIKKSSLINEMVATISVVQDIALRSLYIKECSKIMQVEEQTLYAILEQRLVKKAVELRDNAFRKEQQQRTDAAHQLSADSIDTEPINQINQPTNVNLNIDYKTFADRKKNPFCFEEQQLLYFFIRYVHKIIKLPDGIKKYVPEFIIEQLESDAYQSLDPIFNRVIDYYKGIPADTLAEAREKELSVSSGNLKSNDNDLEEKTTEEEIIGINTNVFINAPDTDISSLAANILNNQYTKSKIHSRFCVVVEEDELLDELVPRIVRELKMKVVLRKIDQLGVELRQAEANGDEDAIEHIMQELQTWTRVKTIFGKSLGERSVI